jgi:eukaryotic-like serine/threonine-protein kinase
MNCAACGATLAGAPRFCPDCGTSIVPTAAPATRTFLDASSPAGGAATVADGSTSAPHRRASAPKSAWTTSSDSLDHGRFLPGTLLLERYRIIALLGRGGMGEVYRADDLRLAQTVALKFLPPELSSDPERLARFHNEARLARQVSHPNVCRVYDIGDLDGQAFMSMEYIDGEDLGSLLRRIGRLPKDKAVEIARQMCAGLAAAHDRGVLHRDLKPANVMIDGRGRARIADFGLAGIAGGGDGGTRAGTPAYMAPEHLTSGETTVKSDLYAVGLVLYEMFTGHRAVAGDSIAEIARQHREVAPTSPSSHIEEFDPVIERVILRCLEKDPRDRPASALAIAAALPGGDPLAMALAAGETPSPEMVAAAGETGGLAPLVVWGLLLAAIVGVAILGPLTRRQSLVQLAAPVKPPAVLQDRARALIAKFGWPDPPADDAAGFGYHRSYLDSLRASGPHVGETALLGRPRPNLLYYWYRQSPRELQASSSKGIVTPEDPPMTTPGMTSVHVTGTGDLWRFFAVPPQKDEAAGTAPAGTAPAPVDWSPFFAEAGLAPSDLKPVEPEWSPPTYADARAAWLGHYADTPEWEVRVEAASYRGRPVAFQVIWPWNRPLLMRPFEEGTAGRIANRIIVSLIASAMFGGLVLARHNIRQGKGDRRGAFRLALAIAVIDLVGGNLRAAHHANAFEEWNLIILLASSALFSGGAAWLYYIALEPLVRKRWPDLIIAWTRLVSGRPRDPLVGREILIGVALGVWLAVLNALVGAVANLNRLPTVFEGDTIERLKSLARSASAILGSFDQSTGQALVLLFIIVVLRVALRRTAPAMAAFALIVAAIAGLSVAEDYGRLALVWSVLAGAVITFATARVGLLALAATLVTVDLVGGLPIVLDPSVWYAGAAALPLLVLAPLAAWAARAALAGRSLFDLRVPGGSPPQ